MSERLQSAEENLKDAIDEAGRPTKVLLRLLQDHKNDAQIRQNRRGEWFISIQGLVEISQAELETLGKLGITQQGLRDAKDKARRGVAEKGIMWTKELDN